jgi:hypothetical protein
MRQMRSIGLVVGTLSAFLLSACGTAVTATPPPAPIDTPVPTSAAEPTAPLTLAPVNPPSAAAPTATFEPISTPLPTPTPAYRALDGSVIPDPDYLAALEAASFSTTVWETDFSLHTVDFDEIFSGGVGRDTGIAPIDDVSYATFAEGDEWLDPLEPVIALEIGSRARAYPLQILIWHEIANDTLAGIPVSVTFCPLCNSAIVFDRRFEGEVLDFGVSGNLRNSDLIMWDRQSESWWQQLTGEGIIGRHAGKQLKFIPAQIVSWQSFKKANPTGTVMSKDTGLGRSYGQNPYSGYDRVDSDPFLFFDDPDDRLSPKERVAAFTVAGIDAAFPYSVLAKERVVNYDFAAEPVVVFYELGTRSALDSFIFSISDDIGATGVFTPVVDGERLTFELVDEGEVGVIRDVETGSTWSILGNATDGPLEGKSLDRVIHQDHFWFAWAAFKPDTRIYRGAE